MPINEKINFAKTVFIGSVKEQLRQEWTWGAAASVGLYQGLKYKGSIKAGLSAGLAVLAVIAAANGCYNLAIQWDKISKL